MQHRTEEVIIDFYPKQILMSKYSLTQDTFQELLQSGEIVVRNETVRKQSDSTLRPCDGEDLCKDRNAS